MSLWSLKRLGYRSILTTVLAGLLASISVVAMAEPVPPGSDDEVRARLQPFGSLCRSGEECGSASATASSGPMGGPQVYEKFCFVCHDAGVGGAPLFGDKAAWADRAAKSMDDLMVSTLNGLNAMPPKGTCMSCSDDELKDAVQFMLDEAN